MKQRLGILIIFILVLVALVGLNAASYTQKQKAPDSEASPNRSTFNPGATGTEAFYTLLSETGRKVIRWQDTPAGLLNARDNKPDVFVVTGELRREFSSDEIEQLLRWVSEGGKLVVIDRAPPHDLITTTANWNLTVTPSDNVEVYGVDPSDQKQMVRETPVSKPVQPALLTAGVNEIQPSRFAGAIAFERFSENGDADHVNKNRNPRKGLVTVDLPSQTAPMVHFVGKDGNLLVEAPFGSGKIIYLADPYIVSNAGISLADNAKLAINLVTPHDHPIAFDEYHLGYGSGRNRFLQFFEGTPVIAIFVQLALLVGFVFYSQSRRFARPVPEPESDRLSKLEYIGAMAELQQRLRAYDLAVENIYMDFRRRATRLLGLDPFTTKTDEMAKTIAQRTALDPEYVYDVLFKCEEIVRGEPTSKREVMELSSALRDLEAKLGLKRKGEKRP